MTESAKKYIDAEELVQFLKRKIKTARSTIEINKLLSEIKENTVGERVVVHYPGWIDVNDRLPDAGQYVLLRQTYHAYGEIPEYENITIGYYFKPEPPHRGTPYFYYAGISNYGDMVRASSMCPGHEYVTHWMPLPDIPKDGEQG